MAPTFGDARDTCVEGPSGILKTLGPLIAEDGWSRSTGQLRLRNGAVIFTDGADDGAFRIQGKNLRGVWADEVGLWKQWEKSWNESIAFAVRFEPGRIVATGTPKIGHGLVRQLLEDDRVVVSRMSMMDNRENLNEAAIEELLRLYGNTRLGAQELDGEWYAEIEGDLLLRSWWRYYPPQRNEETDEQFVHRLPAFDMILHSWDTPLKDKEASDYIAGQAWGVKGGMRYLLRTRVDHMNFSEAKGAVKEMWEYGTSLWPRAQHYVLIENAGFGVELIEELRREITGVQKVNPGAEGNKGSRAFSASPDLESGNCLLPGFMDDAGTGPDELRCPASTLGLINECASFRLDGKHTSHDDQVDAWSMAMNWLRTKGSRPASFSVPTGTI